MNPSYTPLRDGAGVITGVVVLSIEVTQSFLSRQKLIESEAKLRSLTAAGAARYGAGHNA